MDPVSSDSLKMSLGERSRCPRRFPQWSWSMGCRGYRWNTWRHGTLYLRCRWGEKREKRTWDHSPVQNWGEMGRHARSPPPPKAHKAGVGGLSGVWKSDRKPAVQLRLRYRLDHSRIEIRGVQRQPPSAAPGGWTRRGLIGKSSAYHAQKRSEECQSAKALWSARNGS